jgi:hypothetical protein
MQSGVRASPAFASLKYHTRVNFEITRGPGYDLWADSKFDYRAALKFSHGALNGPQGGSSPCIDGIAFIAAMPLDESQRAMLQAFERSMLPHTSLDAGAAAARVEGLAASQGKYQVVARGADSVLEAGTVAHPNRGDLFVLAFSWPSR